MRVLLVTAILVSGGCGSRATVRPAGDAAGDDASQSIGDGAAEAIAEASDKGPGADGACQLCWHGHCPTRDLCLDAPPLEPGVPAIMQDSAVGGFDCAASNPSPNLYYALTVPAQWMIRVVVTPALASEPALVRVLSDCYASANEVSARGGTTTQGRASVCVRNETSVERRVVVAAGKYSGDTPEGLLFDVSADAVAPNLGCSP